MSPVGIADGIAQLLTNKSQRLKFKQYLSHREYGNQQEAEKYCKVLDGQL